MSKIHYHNNSLENERRRSLKVMRGGRSFPKEFELGFSHFTVERDLEKFQFEQKKHFEQHPKYVHFINCDECGTLFSGRYCPKCGLERCDFQPILKK